MIPLEEAQGFVHQSLTALAPVELSLEDTLGCVGAEQLTAREKVPGFTNSAMDGYALRAVDSSIDSVQLRVLESVLAGDVPRQRLEAGDAMRVMTGAPLPEGADCVCKIEEVTCNADASTVTITRTLAVGENVRYPGEDIEIGQVLVTAGVELGPVDLGVLASQGFVSVLVHPRPRVGVLSTGSELTDSTAALAPGKIRDINRPMLLAALRKSGFFATDLGIVRDDESLISAAMQTAIPNFDALISTGGVSVGDVDHVKGVIGELCGERARWMQIAIKPGKPFTFGVAGPRGIPIFGLPGNPVSTLVGFELFVRPALRQLAGHQFLERPVVDAVLDVPMPRRHDGKLHLVHAIALFGSDGRLHVTHVMRQGSHLVSAVAGANAIAMVPDGDGLEGGATVRIMMLELDHVDLARTQTAR
jgi:molybdenum cofactor synthesis domain-containing protein